MTRCPAHHIQRTIVIRRGSTGIARIRLPLDADVGGLDLRAGRLSFFVQPYLEDTRNLYIVDAHQLAPGDHSLSDAVRAPDAGLGCRWGAAAWSRSGLLAARQCTSGQGTYGPTKIFLLSARTAAPLRQGPTVAHRLGIDSLSSDDQGRLLIWHGPGGYVGGITSWTAAGRQVITGGGKCATAEHLAGTTRCVSYPMW